MITLILINMGERDEWDKNLKQNMKKEKIERDLVL